MSVWSKIVGLFASKPVATWTRTWTINGIRNVQTISNVANAGLRSGAKTVLTWGNAAKVAVVGAFTWLFLTGGASNVVSRTLGISEDAAQILIVVGFIVMMFFVVRYLVNYARDRFGLKEEYLRTPIFERHGDLIWDDSSRSWRRLRCSGSL